MNRVITLAVFLAAIWFIGAEFGLSLPDSSTSYTQADAALQEAYRTQTSKLQVQGQGVVRNLLPDDNEGSRHQRFVLELASGQTLLVAHNIDIAPRIGNLKKGDKVEFYGVYEWNPKGGVIHWTHHDPGGHHANGWLKHAGRKYD